MLILIDRKTERRLVLWPEVGGGRSVFDQTDGEEVPEDKDVVDDQAIVSAIAKLLWVGRCTIVRWLVGELVRPRPARSQRPTDD